MLESPPPKVVCPVVYSVHVCGMQSIVNLDAVLPPPPNGDLIWYQEPMRPTRAPDGILFSYFNSPLTCTVVVKVTTRRAVINILMCYTCMLPSANVVISILVLNYSEPDQK